MKFIILIPTLLTLVACHDSVSDEIIRKAYDDCSSNKGVNYLVLDSLSPTKIVCNNGASFKYSHKVGAKQTTEK